MNKIKQKNNIPELRFSEFSGEWEKKKLGNIFDKKSDKNSNNRFNFVLTNSATKGIIGQLDYFDKDIANQGNLTNYYIVDIDDFVYNPRISKSAPVGPLKRNKLKKGVMSPLYTVLRAKNENLDFLEKYFSTKKWHGYMYKIANYGARHDRMNIVQSDFVKMPILIPQKEEQKKIAEFLGLVDVWIDNLEEQKTHWENYKKGMMQKLFPAKDQNVPELRFPEFNKEWTEGEIRNFLNQKIEKNTNNKESLVLSVNNKKGFIAQSEQFEDHVVASKDLTGYKIVRKGDIAYNPSRINVGSIAELKRYNSGIVSPMYVVFSVESELYNYFFMTLLRTHYVRHLIKISCSGSVRDSLSFEMMKGFCLMTPSFPEQKKIADFLSAIDDVITGKDQEITKAREWKKGLMQKMFV